MTLISHKYIDDHDMVARYLADQLSDAERDRLEAYYLEHPELVKELNRTAQFKSGLADLHESGQLQILLAEKPWWLRARNQAIAASLIVVMLFGGLLYRQEPSSRLLSGSVVSLRQGVQGTLPSGNSYNIQRTRSSSYDATIQLPSRPAAIELRVRPEVKIASARYRVSLGFVASDDSIKMLSNVYGLQQLPDGFVPVYLNSAELKMGVYELTISSDADTNGASASSSFLIEVVTPATK